MRISGPGVKMIPGARNVQTGRAAVAVATPASGGLSVREYAEKRIAETGRLVVMHSWAGWNAGGGAQRPQQIADELLDKACVVFCAGSQEPTTAPVEGGPILQTPTQWRQWMKVEAPVRIMYSCWPNIEANIMVREAHTLAWAKLPGWFYIVDIIDAWEGLDRADWYKPEIEAEIVREADLVIATAQSLVERADSYGPKQPAQLLRNSSCIGNQPWAEGPRTVDCVYAGHLRNKWMDWKLVGKLAKKHTVRIIGWPPDNLPVKSKNVEWTGQVPVGKLMALLSEAKVGIIPFLKLPLIGYVDPIKVYDYGLAGLPTIASHLPEIKGRSWVRSANDHRTFLRCVDEALKEEPDRASIASWARTTGTRERRVAELIELIDEAGAWKPKSPARPAPAHHTDEDAPVWRPPVQDWPECKRRVAWLFANTCRAKCFYCGVHKWYYDRTKEGARWWTDELALQQWQRAYDDYGPLVVEMSGLEATDQPELVGGVVKIGHKALLSSNIGMDMERWCEAVPTEGVQLATSFHPEFWADIDEYLTKVKDLREAGYHISGASIIGHPVYFDRIPDWIETLKAHELHTTVHPFQGEYKGVWYPKAFTEEEREFLGQYISAEKNQFALKYDAPNCLCAAGWLYVNIDLDGTVTRCLQNRTEVSGNFFKEPLEFANGPEWCGEDRCVCEQFWPYHIPEGARVCQE